MSILSTMFGGAPATPAVPAPVAPVAAQPGNMPATGDPSAAAPTGEVVPAPTGEQPVVNSPDSPLAQFDDLWSNDPNAAPLPSGAVPALDQAKLQEVIGKADFSKTINPETMSAITAGGEGATQAFADAMNSMQQQAMMQTILAANKMTEQAVNNANTAWESKLPQMLKQQTLTENLVGSNPLFNSPAVKPVMEAVQSQLAAKNPNATAAELAEMTQNFVTVMGEAFNPAAPVVTNPDGSPVAAADDWGKFLGMTQ